MSKGVKTILIIGGILASLAIVCVGGFAAFAYFFVDTQGMENARKEGAAFGQTADNLTCQTKALEMAKPVAFTDIKGLVNLQYFTEGCLMTSRQSPNFCDGLPSEMRDVWNQDRAKDDLCEKAGMKDSLSCRSVMKARLEYCQKQH